MRRGRSAAAQRSRYRRMLLTFAWRGSMSWTRRLSAVAFSLLLLAGVSCTSGDTALTEAPVTASDQPQPQFGLIGDLTAGLTNTVGDLTTTVVGSLASGTAPLTCSPLSY